MGDKPIDKSKSFRLFFGEKSEFENTRIGLENEANGVSVSLRLLNVSLSIIAFQVLFNLYSTEIYLIIIYSIIISKLILDILVLISLFIIFF